MMKKYRVMFPDLNGALRGKVIAEESFNINEKIRMVRSVLVADTRGNEITALPEFDIQSGDKDMLLTPDPNTLIELPNSDGTGSSMQLIADVSNQDGSPIDIAPRTLLKHIIGKYEKEKFEIKTSSELEFYIHHSDGTQMTQSELDIPYGGLNAIYQHEKLLDAIVGMVRTLGLTPEMILSESGMGQFEITFGPKDALFMADRTLYFKQLVKEITREHNLYATFMAKPFQDDAGNGGHIHLSVLKEDKDIFTDEAVLEHFVAGQLRYMRYLAPLFAPNTNSYRRWDTGHGYTVKTVSYGEEGRDTAVRILGEGENRRIEHRLCGADNNAYLSFVAILAAGLEGIRNKWTYTTPIVSGEIGRELPESLVSALDLFNGDEAKNLLGKDFVKTFTAVKQQELALRIDPTIAQEIEDYGQ